jgi:hypothetical protein
VRQRRRKKDAEDRPKRKKKVMGGVEDREWDEEIRDSDDLSQEHDTSAWPDVDAVLDDDDDWSL